MQDLEDLEERKILLSERSYINPIVNLLKTIDNRSCPYKVNLHCHTTYSDGSLEPEKLISKACDINLEHLAITDHHSISAIPIVSQWISKYSDSKSMPTLWPGIEISCVLSGCLVHIIGLGIDINSEFILPYIQGETAQGHYLRAETVINSIRNSKGISILAHPARYRLDYTFLIERAYKIGISGIEVWYDYELSEEWHYSSLICESVNKLTSRYNLLKSCCTDTHGYSILGR